MGREGGFFVFISLWNDGLKQELGWASITGQEKKQSTLLKGSVKTGLLSSRYVGVRSSREDKWFDRNSLCYFECKDSFKGEVQIGEAVWVCWALPVKGTNLLNSQLCDVVVWWSRHYREGLFFQSFLSIILEFILEKWILWGLLAAKGPPRKCSMIVNIYKISIQVILLLFYRLIFVIEGYLVPPDPPPIGFGKNPYAITAYLYVVIQNSEVWEFSRALRKWCFCLVKIS